MLVRPTNGIYCYSYYLLLLSKKLVGMIGLHEIKVEISKLRWQSWYGEVSGNKEGGGWVFVY